MEEKNQSPINRFRQWIKKLAGNLFAAPYLPLSLNVFFIATVITNLTVIFMSQPQSYWNDPQSAVGWGIFGEPLTLGAAELIIAAVAYTIFVSLLFLFLNYRWGMVIWLTTVFSHFYFIEHTLIGCYISRWSALFSGLCQFAEYGILWMAAAFIAGILLVFTFQPAEFSPENKIVQKGTSCFSALMVAGWVALMFFGIILSAMKPTYGWVPVEIKNGPGVLQEAESAYDTGRNRLVMFGGSTGYLGGDQWNYKNDTWEWDGNQWLNMPASETPTGRADHAMAYDEKRGVTVLFGGFRNGERLSDTWEWDGKLWKKIDSANTPTPRSGHEMVYDRARETIVLYGGYGNEIFYNDAWEWDGANWAKIPLESGSPTASVFALAYDPNQNYTLILLSGSGGTWRWKGNTWTRQYPDIEPSNRGWTTLVYDSKREVFFTFGGISRDAKRNDTWTYDGKAWSEFTSGGLNPSARADMVIWYDPIREHVMLYGGYDDDNALGDMWEFIPPEE